MLWCPNLVGTNLLEEYKEKHKLGVYEDEDEDEEEEDDDDEDKE